MFMYICRRVDEDIHMNTCGSYLNIGSEDVCSLMGLIGFPYSDGTRVESRGNHICM